MKGAKDQPNKLKFMTACEHNDANGRGILPEYLIEVALTNAQFTPMPPKSDRTRLFKALEISDGDNVNYRKLL